MVKGPRAPQQPVDQTLECTELGLNASSMFTQCELGATFPGLSMLPCEFHDVITLFYFIFKLIFIGVWLLYNIVSISAVQQSESAIRIHIYTLFWISFPFRSSQSIEYSSLSNIVGSLHCNF